ncbi:hypothetical protein F0562_017819 [Nyssa sinensis]|uniref:Uncharacterized protein n=1 Tax=Nyssa sinensis TaxID=561372 RepID=A0A5J4ZK09_9ASTE|nr:hypothetical protein F0562_017819 [Nyssa sinensis]
MHTLRTRVWLQDMEQANDKKGMLAVQSLRNTLMATYTHCYNSHFHYCGTGSCYEQHIQCKPPLQHSMALGCLIDANFLINATAEFSSPGYTETVLERGFMLAVVGNRVLCITFTLLLWMFGPVPVVVSSVALIWGLYELDFAGSFTKSNK